LTILSSCQQSLPEDDRISTERLLENFCVGTQKAKLYIYAPCSSDELLPIREVDFRSIHKRAIDRIEKRRPGVSESENDDDEMNNNNTLPIITEDTTPSYRNICKFIHVLKKQFPDNDSSCFDLCTGYKILETRAHPITIKRAGSTTRHFRQLKLLVDYANNKYRS
jgi:hypothetical protein